MKKIIVSLFAVTALLFSANAQIERKPATTNTTTDASTGDAMQMSGDHPMMGKMNLTDAQKQQMKAIQMDFKTKMATLDKSDNMNVKDYKAQKEQLMQDRKAKIQALLTPDQKAQMGNAMQGQMQKGNKAMHKGELKELGLSKAQMGQLKSQRQTMKGKMEAIQSDQSLTPAQKKDQMQALKASNREAMKTILTPEQLSKLEADKSASGINK